MQINVVDTCAHTHTSFLLHKHTHTHKNSKRSWTATDNQVSKNACRPRFVYSCGDHTCTPGTISNMLDINHADSLIQIIQLMHWQLPFRVCSHRNLKPVQLIRWLCVRYDCDRNVTELNHWSSRGKSVFFLPQTEWKHPWERSWTNAQR